MAQEFFNSATGNNQILKRMLAWQSADGLAVEGVDSSDVGDYVPFLSDGGAVSPSPAYLERAKISSSPMRGAPLVSKLDFTNGVLDMGDLDPGCKAQHMLLLNYFQRYLTSNPSGAHYRHRISANQTNLHTKKLSYINDIDEGIPVRFKDLIVGGWTLRAAARENLRLSFTVFPGKMDYWGDVVPDGGNTGTVNPRLQHFTSGNWAADATDKDLYIKIVSDTATTVTFQVKEASAGTYSGNQTATKGQWTYAWLGASIDQPYGTRSQQVMVYFDTGSDGDFVTNDIFQFPKRREIGTLSYATTRIVSETQARFYLDGIEVGIDNGVTVTAGIDEALTRYAPGSEQPIGTYRSGFQNISVAVEKRHDNLDLQKALMTRGQKTMVLECKTDTAIGATSAFYGLDFVFANLYATGSRFDVAPGGQNRTESLTFLAKEASSAFVWRGMNFTADCEVVSDTDLATIHS